MTDRRLRVPIPLIVAVAAVGVAVGGLLLGYEPIGGDPDCLYRPIKTELVRALRQGTLPFWSDRFGLGAPLVAESHVAAFYPPNWLLYGALGASPAYGLSMWLHYLAIVLATYAYARSLGITPWGGALAGVSFALCGFQMSHACHEPFYCQLPYLPLALWLAERYLAAGGRARLAGLALTVGAQLTLGHFQIQTWTAGLVVLTALWRAKAGTSSWRRAAVVVGAVAWGVAVAAAQLGLTAELTRIVGFERPAKYMSVYSFPPAHWAQLALPALFMTFKGGPRDMYWGRESTSSDEACLYVGTVTLILAAVGYATRRDRSLAAWKWLAPLGFVLATMPRWWPSGFDLLLSLPVIGHFRAPGRYTLLTSLGLCLLAGRGLDRAVPAATFWVGLVLAAVFGGSAFAWGNAWASQGLPREALAGHGGTDFLIQAAVMWVVALGVVLVWRLGPPRDAVGFVPLLLAAVELTYLFHHGTTPFGWPTRLPEDSPVFRRLGQERDVALIEGTVYNLPVASGGLTAAFPYLAIFPPPPNYLLRPPALPQEYDRKQFRWLVRSGVSHGIFEGDRLFRHADVLYIGPDPALDRMIPADEGKAGQPRLWRLERYDQWYPPAHLARNARTLADWYEMYPTLSNADDPDTVFFLAKDRPADSPGPRARSARLVSWDGRSGSVEHDGTVDLVLRRTFYPGWTARLDDGPEIPITPADGGFQSIRIPGAGTTRVSVRYRPTRLAPLGCVSLGATAAALIIIAVATWKRQAR